MSKKLDTEFINKIIEQKEFFNSLLHEKPSLQKLIINKSEKNYFNHLYNCFKYFKRKYFH